MKLAEVVLGIKNDFDVKNLPLPRALFFSSDRSQEVKTELKQIGATEDEAAKVDARGFKFFGMKLMAAEPVPYDQIWVFDRAGNKVATYNLGEANASAH